MDLRKSVVSIKFPPVTLGLEMAVPFYGRLAFFGCFCWKTPHAPKIPPLRGLLGFSRMGGGWKCQFYFYGRGDFSDDPNHESQSQSNRAIRFGALSSYPTLKPCVYTSPQMRAARVSHHCCRHSCRQLPQDLMACSEDACERSCSRSTSHAFCF